MKQATTTLTRAGMPRTVRNRSFDESVSYFFKRISGKNFSEKSQAYANSYIKFFAELEFLVRKVESGDFDQIELMAKGLNAKIRAQSLPAFFREAAGSRLAYVFSTIGDFESAAELREEHFKNAITSRGRANQETMKIADGLVHSLFRSDRPAKGFELAKSNLQIAQENYSKSHPVVLMALNTIGALMLEQEEYTQAVEILEPSFAAIKRSTLEQNSDPVLSLTMNYGYALIRSGAEQKGFEVLSKLRQIYANDFGPKHLNTAQTEKKLAEAALRLDQPAIANKFAMRAMEKFELLAVHHPIRVFGSITALQCAHANGDEQAKNAIFENHINPLFAVGGALADQVDGFLDANKELRPFDIDDFMDMIKGKKGL